MGQLLSCFCLMAMAMAAAAQQSAPPPTPAPALAERQPAAASAASPYTIAPGTHIPVSLINSISTRTANVGDRIYLQTAFPVSVNGKIVIPEGSWVTGTVVSLKRPERKMRGGELRVRFDSLVLPNGVSRSFTGDLGSVDARDNEKVNREGGVSGPPSGKAGTVVVPAATGAMTGALIGSVTSHAVQGGLIGAAAGAGAGAAVILFSKGKDATLNRGSVVEMVLDRPLQFNENELDFHNLPPRGATPEGSRPATSDSSRPAGWPATGPIPF